MGVDKQKVMFAPVRCEPNLLLFLDDLLHPEIIPQDIREGVIPGNVQDLLQSIVMGLSINWEDIPDPGITTTRKN